MRTTAVQKYLGMESRQPSRHIRSYLDHTALLFLTPPDNPTSNATSPSVIHPSSTPELLNHPVVEPDHRSASPTTTANPRTPVRILRIYFYRPGAVLRISRISSA
ncbi:hypothetical protein VTJ04DRAFT_2282 [Mycothermus thermophilus]|uniref:uncharacterized protein n=1 Tax=Humicola insolens TaxID=85995 RepID=UPI003742E4CB